MVQIADVRDFFTDPSVVKDPHSYYELARSQGPVWCEPHHGTFVVTGFEEASAVYRDPQLFSSCNAFGGPFPGLPEQPSSDDASTLIERHRAVFPCSDTLITFDPPKHHEHRRLMMRLLTPKRLQENEAYTWTLATELIDSFGSRGHCEFVGEYAQPLAMLVIADLLGVPPADQAELKRRVRARGPAGSLGQQVEGNFLDHLEDLFRGYVEDCRAKPRADVLTKMALGTFTDGSLPSVTEVARLATFLFSGGQGTVARFLANALRFLAEQPGIQDLLRQDPDHIPEFIEEMLRLDSPVKTNFRMARRTTHLGGVVVPAGSTLMLLLPAADRDPRQFDEPGEFRLMRSNAREHVAFGRGPHSCPGAPLVRHEAHITLQCMLERLADLRLSQVHHGPPGARRFDYTPTYILHGVEALYLEFTSI